MGGTQHRNYPIEGIIIIKIERTELRYLGAKVKVRLAEGNFLEVMPPRNRIKGRRLMM